MTILSPKTRYRRLDIRNSLLTIPVSTCHNCPGSLSSTSGLRRPIPMSRIFWSHSGEVFYWNTRYLDGYTNKGNIMGNATVGRQGIAFRAASTWWFASDRTVQLGYRTNVVDHDFLQGGSLRDIHLRSEWSFNKGVSLSSFLQYEWWNFPLLSAGKKQSVFTITFQLTYCSYWILNSVK